MKSFLCPKEPFREGLRKLLVLYLFTHWFWEPGTHSFPAGPLEVPADFTSLPFPNLLTARPPARNPAVTVAGDGRGLNGVIAGCFCLHVIPEEGGDRGPLPQPVKIPGPSKPQPQQLETGSHPGPRAATAPFVYGHDVRRWGLRAPGGNLACSCSTNAAQVSALDTALLPCPARSSLFGWRGKEEPLAGFLFWVLWPQNREG